MGGMPTIEPMTEAQSSRVCRHGRAQRALELENRHVPLVGPATRPFGNFTGTAGTRIREAVL
jgi:hypothetical protein